MAGPSRLGVLALLLAAACGSLAAAPRQVVQDGRWDPSLLTSRDPVLAELFALAEDCGFRLGVWGGAVRDLLLSGELPPEGSDYDLVYDSRELEQALKQKGLRKRARIARTYLRLNRRYGRDRMRRYTFMKCNRAPGFPQSVHRLMDTGGLTLNQVALMSDGSVFDPSGGLADLRARTLRYRVPGDLMGRIQAFRDVLDPSPYDVLRAVRFKCQYRDMNWDEETVHQLKEIMRAFAPESERTRDIAGYYRGMKGRLRRLIPKKLHRVVSSVKNRLGMRRHRHLRPYIEKGYAKLLHHSADPREALRWVEELGLDRFAVSIGLGEWVGELRRRAAGGAPAAPGAAFRPELEEATRIGSRSLILP